VRKIVVVGGGGHAKVLISQLKKLRYDVAGYTDDASRGAILGAHYLGDDRVLGDLAQGAISRAAIGVGKPDVSSARLRLLTKVLSLGLETPPIVSPHSVVNAEVVLGTGTTVFDGAVVNSGAVIGDVCIINSNSTVEHDCLLGDNVHIAPGATVAGSVSIGDNCMIGAGSTLVHGVSVTAGCLVGAGSTVVRDIGSPGTYVGSPARRIR
jgi:sugar O-acyltransferase (sialic acid O-acetyltransferase NeuD family)